MGKWIKRLIILLIVAGAGFGAYSYFSKDKDSVSYITEAVQSGNIRRVVNATGEVSAENLVNVGAQVSGQIERLYVKLGQSVKKGELIAQIDSTTQQNELDINKSKLQSYISQLQAAQVSLKVATIQYEREKFLAGDDATSEANLENAEDAYASAKSRVTDLQSLIKQAEISVMNSEVNLGYTTIIAPMDGTIVAVPAKEGQTVNANQTTPNIVQIADLTRMEILIQISEGDVTKLAPGMKVTYTVLSEPSRIYEAELKSIDPGLTTLSNGTYSGVIDANAAIYYYGRIEAPNNDGKLRIGMTTQSTIIVENAENVLTVPSMAITKKDGKSYVYVLAGGVTEEREIATGISDNLRTEVISGLASGEEVITSQMTAQEISDSAANTRVRMRM